jgi:hypothetical protein
MFFFLKWGKKSPQLLHPSDAHDFLLDYSQHFTREIQKINLEASSLNLHRHEGVTIHQLTSFKKPNAFPSRPIAGEKHI